MKRSHEEDRFRTHLSTCASAYVGLREPNTDRLARAGAKVPQAWKEKEQLVEVEV